MYVLADKGFSLRLEVLTPFRIYRYHVQRNIHIHLFHLEINMNISTIVIQVQEIVLKGHLVWHFFRVLARMPQYPFRFQVHIVLVCCVLHNFIRRSNLQHNLYDPDYDDEEDDYDDDDDDNGDNDYDGYGQLASDQREQMASVMWAEYVN